MKKTSITILIIIGTIVTIGTIAAVTLLNSRTPNTEPVRLYLPQDTTFETFCDSQLNTEHLALNTATFRLMARTLGLHKHVRPGSYVVEPHMKKLTLVRKLRNGQQDPLRLTIGKFRTPQQLNQYLDSKLMHDDFNVTLDSFHLIRPDTYEFYWTVTPAQFMQRMVKEYQAFWQSKGNVTSLPLTPSHSLSRHEIIILASIVEEETNNNPEKPLIASVYLNRLRQGIPLQADPTVKYALSDFTLRRILNKHLAVESPFNTYLHTGLPPAPICLPSDASVNAVLNAPQTNYIYFCASDNMDGTHRFAATLAEHNSNAARFHDALNRRGIR